MFNFKNLKLVKRCDSESNSSFVGIRRSADNNMEFRLPHGFDEFPEQDFEATKNFFFKMYRTFKKFERDSTREILDLHSAGKDHIETQGNGYRFKDKKDNQVILYSKIALIENLLEVYNDLALDVMERRIGREEKVDYSKIEHYLHRAVYLPNDVIFIDEMNLPRQTLRYEATTLIDLFCFILFELQTKLEQETEPRVQELAYRFAEQHLNHDQSLFNEETFEITIQILKDVLDDVDKYTVYKDEDYWRLYDAIELFLYGELDMEHPHEDGTYWGINKFSSVWEDMCATYAFANFDVVYADTNIIFNGKHIANAKSAGYFPIFKKTDFIDPFFIEFRDKKRWMRPDLIHNGAKSLDWIFKDAIKVTLKKDYGLTIDFEVKLIDREALSMYEGFCSRLRKNIKGGRNPRENSFINYSKSELEKQKNIIKGINRSNSMFRLLDWKYMNSNSFINPNSKLENDINKQLCYELTLQILKINSLIESQFIIPWFYYEPKKLEEEIGDFVDNEILYPRLRDNEIKVFKANFQLIQKFYLNHD